jgi:hypothetical protein
VTCVTCGKAFVEVHTHSNTNHAERRYCSAHCRVAPRRAKSREERRERYRWLKDAGAPAWPVTALSDVAHETAPGNAFAKRCGCATEDDCLRRGCAFEKHCGCATLDDCLRRGC